MPKAPTGTEEDPFTCAGANTFVASLTASTPTETEYYVKGKVCAIEENFNFKNGMATFWISDDGTQNGKFYIYRTNYFEGAHGGRIPNLGDEVILYGKLVNYQGTTPATASGECRLVSINDKTTNRPIETNDLFDSLTDGDVDMYFVAGCMTEPGKPSTSTNIGCSVGYAVSNNPATYSGAPTAIDANYESAVTIPEVVEELEVRTVAPSAFAGAKLSAITIPATVWDIETDAFKDCQNLASITLPEGVILNAGSFQNCTALASIELPKGVQLYGYESGAKIFGGCTNLTAITVNDETPYNLQGSYLVDNPSKVTLYVPAGAKTAYEATDYWKDFNIVEMPAPENLELTIDMFHVWDGCSATSQMTDDEAEGEIHLNETLLPGNIVYGQADVYYQRYADLTGYMSLVIEGTPGVQLRVLLNRLEVGNGGGDDHGGDWTEVNSTIGEDGKVTINIAKYEFFHLNAIKLDWGSPEGTINSLTLKRGLEVIAFNDQNVKTLCVDNWDTSGDGELSEIEAAAVTDLGEVFKENGEITSFDELQFFTGLTSIGDYAFQKCEALETIIIPEGVTTIGQNAFSGCYHLWSVKIPNSVTTIKGGAFIACINLTTIILPQGLTSIGSSAFYSCAKLESINLLETKITSISDYLFSSCDALASISIPAGVTTIGKSAFEDCDVLSNVNMPNSLEIISEGAFYACDALASIDIPNSVTTIGKQAFSYCLSLTSITIPHSVTSIGETVFEGCDNLTEVYVNWATPVAITEDVFSNRTNATLYVPAGSKAAYQAADYWKDFGEIYEIFSAPIQLNDGTVDAQFRIIDENAKTVETFGTYGLGPAIEKATEGSITIPAEVNGYQVVGIGSWSFYSCQKITQVNLPGTLTYIGESAFRMCYQLQEMDVPEGVITIGDRAFYNGIRKLTLPSTLQELGSDIAISFSGNSGNVLIVKAVTPIAIGEWSIRQKENTTLYVPVGCKAAYEAADYWKDFNIEEKTLEAGDLLMAKTAEDVEMAFVAGCPARPGSSTGSTNIGCSVGYAVNGMQTGLPAAIDADYNGNVTIPETVEGLEVRTIAPYAFANTKLKGVIIPSNVWDIEVYAFSGCTELAAVSLPENIILNRGTFKDCTSLTDIKLPKGVILYGGSNDDPIFSGCTSLTAIRVFDETPYALENKLVDDPSKVTLYVPAGSKAAYETADYWKDFGEIYEIFSAPIQLNDGTVDAQFRIIDENAKTVETFGTFRLGPAIEKATEGSITIPAEVNGYQVVGIGSWSFRDCENITHVSLPATITTIGASAFRTCYQLQEVNIPEGVTSIGLYAFKGCIFSSLTLPSSLQTIEEVAFEGCNELTSVTMSGSTPPTIGEYTFNINNPSNVTIYVPLGSLVAYQAADYWKNFNIVELDNRDYLLNGDMEGNDVSCFYLKEPDDTDPVPSTIVDGVGKDGSRCIVVNSADNPANIWDTQFYVRLTKPLPAGTRYHLKFDYKASQEAEVHTQSQQEPGGYLAMNLLNNLYFTEEWQTYDEYGVISDSQSPADKMQTIAFDLAVSESATTYYFDNFFFEIDNTPLSTVTERPEGKTLTYTGEAQELAIAGTCENGTMLYSLDGDTFSEEIPTATEAGQYFIYYKVSANEGYADSETYAVRTIILPKEMANIIINSSMEGDDTSCFFFSQKTDNSEEENPAEQSTIVDGVGVDGSRGIVVQSSDNAENDWDTQFFVRLPYSLPAGTLYRLKFNYKASQEARGHSEMHEQPRTYLWEGFGDQYFTTEWQSYETTGAISANQSPEGNMQTIAFDLNISKEAIDYYFDNFTFEVDANLSIPFADAQVKELCVANWDTNSDGELSVSEAAAVTNEQFADLSFESVTADSWTFDELQYFTGLTVLNTKLAETKISSVKIPVKVTEIGADAFRKTLLTSITLPNAVKRVGERAFSECGELVTANLGRVEEIDVNAFIAAGIVNLTLPGTVKTVGIEPFSWNWTMKQATLEEGVTKVPDTMFHGNVNLTTVSLPSTLTTIEPRAFQQCEALTTISIPESVTTIAEQAFNKCTSLVEVTVANPTPVAITEEVFSNRKNATLYVPDGCVAAYRAADYWKEFKRILVVGTIDPVNETDISQMPNAIYMEPITGRVGRKFWAELKLKNEYDIRAYQFDIELPVGVTIATDEDGKYIYEQGGRHEDVEPVLNYNEASSTYYMRVIDDVAAGDGVIWKLNLKVAEGLALGDYPVVFTNVKYTPADGQDTQDIPDVTCRLMIEEHGYLKGDANDDDIVNIADVVCIVNHSAHFDTPIFVETSADVTGNGKADLTDAVKIIDYIIGRIDDLTNAPAMARAFKAPAMAPTLRAQSIAPASGLSVEKVSMAYASDVSILENAIYADNLTVKSGQTCPLTIFLKNAKQTNGYQFQLVLPEGVTIPKDDKGKYACELSSRHQGHKVEINYKDGAYKVLVYSQSSEALTGNDGEICTIQLQVADNMVNGDYTLTIKEAAYSLISGASWVSLPKADIRLSNFVKGDANGNGYVDIDDAVCIVDHIVGKSTPGFIEAAADVNNDNIVDIADAVAIVNYITGKSSALSQ